MNLTDIASVASILSLVGLLPVIYNAGLQLRERRRRNRSELLRDTRFGTWQIVRPSYSGNMARVEDVTACQLVAGKLASLGLSSRIQDHRERLEPGTNVVLICGPKANEQSRTVAATVRLPMVFDMSRSPQAIIDQAGGQEYTSPSDRGTQADLALFGRVTVLETPYYVLWGLHGLGTIGAAKALASDKLLSDAVKQVGGKDFVGVLHVPYTSVDNVGQPRWLAPPVSL